MLPYNTETISGIFAEQREKFSPWLEELCADKNFIPNTVDGVLDYPEFFRLVLSDANDRKLDILIYNTNAAGYFNNFLKLKEKYERRTK